MTITLDEVRQWVEHLVTGASLLANMLPREEVFCYYPPVQRFYGTMVKFIAGIALNWRYRQPSLDLSAPFLGLSKPAGQAPPPSLEELRGEVKCIPPVLCKLCSLKPQLTDSLCRDCFIASILKGAA